jgi:cyclohexanone monooxygenase
VESYIYLPLLEELGGPFPPEKYATGKYILKHVGDIDKKWGLSNKALFRTEVVSMTWDDERSQWIVRTNRHDIFRACHVVTATGVLHNPKLPGHSWHCLIQRPFFPY